MTSLQETTFDTIVEAISRTPGVLQPKREAENHISFSHLSKTREHYDVQIRIDDDHLVVWSMFSVPANKMFAAFLLCATWDETDTTAVAPPEPWGDVLPIAFTSQIHMGWTGQYALQPLIQNMLSQLDDFNGRLKGVLAMVPNDSEIQRRRGLSISRIAEATIANWLSQ
jgi:hypothetical protein